MHRLLIDIVKIKDWLKMSSLERAMGKRLAFLRQRKLISIEKFSKLVNLPEFILMQYEFGERRISPRHLLLICDALDTTLEEFMNGVVE